MNGTTRSGRSQTSLIAIVGLAALLMLFLGTRGCWSNWPGFESMSSPLFGGWGFFHHWGLLGLGGILQIALAVWVGVDAQRRGLNGLLWGLLVLFTFIVGLLVYLIVATSMSRNHGASSFPLSAGLTAPPATAPAAPAAAAASCPSCSAAIEPSFKVCPYCGTALRCANCDLQVQAGWKLCPHCGTTLDE